MTQQKRQEQRPWTGMPAAWRASPKRPATPSCRSDRPGGKRLQEQVSSGCRGPFPDAAGILDPMLPPCSHVSSLSQVLFWLRNPLIAQDCFNGSVSIFILGWQSASETQPSPLDVWRPVPESTKFLAASSKLRTEPRDWNENTNRRRPALNHQVWGIVGIRQIFAKNKHWGVLWIPSSFLPLLHSVGNAWPRQPAGRFLNWWAWCL